MTHARRDILRSQLEAYNPGDALERAHAARMIELLATEQPFFRSQFEPGHFTASAFVLAPDGASLLLIHHARIGRWLQPGGHVEGTDGDLMAAARREVAEEVGLDDVVVERPAIFDVDVHVIAPGKGEPAHEHFDVRFLFRAPTMNFLLNESEAKAARFVALEALYDDTAQDESVLRAVRKLRDQGFGAR